MLIGLVFQYTTPSPFIQEDAILEGSMKVDFKFMIETHTDVETLEDQRTRFPADAGPDLHGSGPQWPPEVISFRGVCFNFALV